jgi:hypothetical protein
LVAQQAELIAAIKQQDTLHLVVLDTLNRSLRGSENDAKDMAYIAAADAIRETFACAVTKFLKDGPSGDIIASKLEFVEVGKDRRPIDVCFSAKSRHGSCPEIRICGR